MLAHYSGGKTSALSLCRRRSYSSSVMKQLNLKAKRTPLPPLTKTSSLANFADFEPLPSDTDPNKVIYTITPQKRMRHSELKLEPLPIICEYDTGKAHVLHEKIKLCMQICNFIDPEADLRAKSIKAQTLSEILRLFNENKYFGNMLTQTQTILFFDMFRSNLIRTIPPVSKVFLFFDEPTITDIQWPHLSLVYQLLLTYQSSCPTEQLLIPFAEDLFENFKAPDVNERAYVVDFFSSFLDNFPDYQDLYIRKCSAIIASYLNGEVEPFCLTPVLTIYQKFSLFTKNFVLTSVAPLLSACHYLSIAKILQDIFVSTINNDTSSCAGILEKVFSRWPCANPPKQVAFLELLTTLISISPVDVVEGNIAKIIGLIARETCSPASKVADAAMSMWLNDAILTKLANSADAVLPVVFPAISRTMKEHWSRQTQGKAHHAMRAMHDVDPFLFDELSKKSGNNDEKNVNTHKVWSMIAREASKSDHDIYLAKLLSDIQQIFGAKEQAKYMTLMRPTASGPVRKPKKL